MKRSFLFVAAIAMCNPAVGREASVPRASTTAKPTIQEQFDQIINAQKNSPQARKVIEALRGSVSDKSEIIEQLADYAGTSGEQQPLKALAILQMLDLPPKVIIPSLVPYLNDEDKKIRSFVRDWFQGHDNAGANETKLKPVNFEDYADYVRKFKQADRVPLAFVQYMFERSPNRAFLVFVRTERQSDAVKGLAAIRKKMEQQRANGLKGLPQPRAGVQNNDLLLAEHLISNAIWLKRRYFHEKFPAALSLAKKQLAKLAKHDKWWARLYVAELMQQHRELRQADLVKLLSKDGHDLVRKSVNASAN